MFSQKRNSFARLALHGLVILGLMLGVGAGASHAGAAVVPTNDNFATPVKITVLAFSHAIADMTLATTDPVNDPFLTCTGDQGEASLWYTFTPTYSGELTVATTNSTYDTVLAVLMDDPLIPGAVSEIGFWGGGTSCNDDVSATVKTSSLTLALRGGVKYYVEVTRKSGTPVTPPDTLRLQFRYTPKTVLWGAPFPLGKGWDASTTGTFYLDAGWSIVPVLGANGGSLRVATVPGKKAVAYFDGEWLELYYAMGPNMGHLEVWVDGALQATLGQGAITYSFPAPVLFGPFYDGVHKLTLVSGVPSPFGQQANIDYIMVYSPPDLIPPDQIVDLLATTGTTTGQVMLKWTSVGDDGLVGTATKYEVQYMLDDGAHSCIADWGGPDAVPYTTGLPTPKIAGTVQTALIKGLVPGQPYLFCIAAIDDGGNYGLPSNDDFATAFAGVPIGTGTYDDKHAGWTYTGNWKYKIEPGARNNTLHYSNKVGDAASFFFTGTQFVFTYTTGPIGALLDVYIDGIYQTTLDTYSPFPDLNRSYTSPMLVPGPHIVRFVHNYFGPPPPQIQVTVDQIYIHSPVDFGPPDPIIDLLAVPGLNDGEVDLFWTATGDDPGGVGTATKYEIRYSPNPILSENDWFYARPAGGVVPAPQPAGAGETATIVGLTPGMHYYFAVRAFDNAFYQVLSTFSGTEDAIATYSGLWYPGGIYDDAALAWTYNGGWTLQANGYATNATQHVSGYLATSAVFHFTGSGFILTFMRNALQGKLDVYVDGVKVGTINQAMQPWGYQMTWDSITYIGALPAGNHVVEFVVGGRVNIDEIQIVP